MKPITIEDRKETAEFLLSRRMEIALRKQIGPYAAFFWTGQMLALFEIDKTLTRLGYPEIMKGATA